MKLIFAQGNPGDSYTHTRHNVGYLAVDAFASDHSVTWSKKAKFHALIAECMVDGQKVVMAKPTTFYNQTGQSIRALIDFYSLDATTDVLVVHDELALPFGTIRVRHSGSDAGNNGIKSISAHIGSDFTRLRIGIGSPIREVMGDADFVLARFSKEEAQQLPTVFDHTTDTIQAFIDGSLQAVTKSLEN